MALDIEDGQIKLVFLTLDKRSTAYPQTPLVKDLGYDIPSSLLFIVGPKGLPKEIAEKLEDAFAKAMNYPLFIKGMKDLRITTFYRNSEELENYIVRTYGVYAKIIKEMGLAK